MGKTIHGSRRIALPIDLFFPSTRIGLLFISPSTRVGLLFISSSSPHRQGLLPIDKGCSPSTSCSPSTVKVWNLTNCKLRCTLAGHGGYVNTIAVSPDGSLCASGGKDGVTLLWDLAEGKKLHSLDAGAIIHALCFSPNRYWLCAATQDSDKIWDLEGKTIVQELKPEATPGKNQVVLSLWAAAVIGSWCNFLTVIYIVEAETDLRSSIWVEEMCMHVRF